MNPLLTLCLSLAAPAPAHAVVEQTPPSRVYWEEQLKEWIGQRERSQLLLLAELFPRLFGMHFVCQYQPDGSGSPARAVLPGESLSAPEGGLLHCPGQFEARLEKKSQLDLSQIDSRPFIDLHEGRISMSFGPVKFFLRSPAFDLALAGEGREQAITVAAVAPENSLLCERGAVSVDLAPREVAGKKFLYSRDCRLSLTFFGGVVKRYLLAGDQVSPEDIAAPRQFWPESPARALHPELASYQSSLELSRSANPNSLHWSRRHAESSTGTYLACTVFGQKTDAEAFRPLASFLASTPSGDFPLDPSFREGYASLLCDTENTTYASNGLEFRASAAIPPAATPAPAPEKLEKKEKPGSPKGSRAK